MTACSNCVILGLRIWLHSHVALLLHQPAFAMRGGVSAALDPSSPLLPLHDASVVDCDRPVPLPLLLCRSAGLVLLTAAHPSASLCQCS